MKVRDLLQRLVLIIAPMLIGGLTYLFADVVTLKADVRNQEKLFMQVNSTILKRLDTIERKIDRLYDKR